MCAVIEGGDDITKNFSFTATLDTTQIRQGSAYTTAGDGAALTDAILRRIDGLGVYYAVFVNGDEMGLVEDDDRMKAMLRSNLYYQIPNSAIYASYHGEIDIRAVYAPDGMTTPYDDMVLLVRGRAPIRCVDAEGNTYVV